MGNNNEWKSTLNYVYLDGHAKDWAITEANKQGVSISGFVGLLVEERYEQCILNSFEWDKKCDVYEHHWFCLRSKMLKRVKRHAADYLDNPDDEAKAMLESMCERIGRDVDEIIAEVEGNPFAAVAARERNESKRGECVLWLADLFAKSDGEVDTSVVYDLAKTQGFSSSTLNRAKSDINNDPNTPAIKSDRDGARHIWRMIEH